MGTFLLRGKSHPVTIYQIVKDGALDAAHGLVYTESFPTALELIRARQWQQSEAALPRCLELEPDKGLSRFYLEFCRAHRRKPPVTDWQGIIPLEK